MFHFPFTIFRVDKAINLVNYTTNLLENKLVIYNY